MTSPPHVLAKLVDAHWTTAARHAWRQYQSRGRGAIVFVVTESGGDDAPVSSGDGTVLAGSDEGSPLENTGIGSSITSEGTSGERTPLRYLTFTDARASEGPFKMLYSLVQRYDPEREVVIAAVLPDDRTVFDVYERAPTPPEAADTSDA